MTLALYFHRFLWVCTGGYFFLMGMSDAAKADYINKLINASIGSLGVLI